MKYTPRESTVPNEHQLEQKAAHYAQLHPDGAPPKRHLLSRLFRRARADAAQHADAPTPPRQQG